MCTVRQYNRRARPVLCLLAASTAVIGILTLSAALPMPDANVDSCHAIYTLQIANASSCYEESYVECELTANETRLELAIDEELERDQIQQGSNVICGNLEQCESLDDNLEFFKCIGDNAHKNMDVAVEMRFNASSAHTRLHTDYDEAHRTFLLCTLEAQHVFLNSMRAAHGELAECLDDSIVDNVE